MSVPLTICLFSWSTTDILWVTALAYLICSDCAANAKFGTGIFLQLNIKLELGPTLSTVVGCTGRNLGGDTGTYRRMMCGTEWDMWKFC